MNKQEFLEVIDKLNLPKDQYCIIASGVMLMHGLREQVDDVDLKVSPELFEDLMRKYNMQQSSRYDYVYELNGNIDVNCVNFDPNAIEITSGYPVENLEKQLAWKLANNRPKDQDDIRKIQEYLAMQRNKLNDESEK